LRALTYLMQLPYILGMKADKVQPTRKRDDPRRDVTRIALIEAAERLFAESGVETVSTRQIGAAVGSLNTNVVSYHFGDKDGLIEAVFHHRLPGIDRRRAELLAEAEMRDVDPSLASLVHVFALPLFEQTDSTGRHSYARFLLGLERSGMLEARGRLTADYPETARLTSRMAALLPAGISGSGHFRMRLIVGLLGAAFQLIDQDHDMPADAARQLFETAVTMAASAYGATGAQQGSPT